MRACKLNRKQKELLTSQGRDPKQYHLFRDLPNSLILKDRKTGELTTVEKGGAAK